VIIEIKDDFGSNGNLKFAIGQPDLSGLTSVDGTGTLDGRSTGSAKWLLIPRREAAPEEDTLYHVHYS
jgi:hypothetical protein